MNLCVLYRKPKYILWIVFLFALLSLLILSMDSSSHPSDSHNHGNIYSSRDTSLQTHSSRFCESLSIEGASHSAQKVQLTLYLLNKEIKATKEEVMDFSKTISVDRSYKYWMFHLLPNSRIQLSACVVTGNDALFYLVEGVHNFERWQEDGVDHYLERVKVTSKCDINSVSQDSFYNYRIHSENRYYLIYESKRNPSTLRLSFSITQVLHKVEKEDIINQCSVPLNSIESCNLPVSFWSSSSMVLLQLEPQLGAAIDWEANNEVEVMCNARLWLYIVLCLTIPLAMSLISIAIACTCFLSWFNQVKIKTGISNYTDKEGTRKKPSDPRKADTESEDRPPPYNYNYPPPYRP